MGKTALAARTLATGERAICPDCQGSGTHVPLEYIHSCRFCGPTYCEMHRCKACRGKGAVCPHCMGMRFVREPSPRGNDAVICPTCCEGNNVNDLREMDAIRAYIARSGKAVQS